VKSVNLNHEAAKIRDGRFVGAAKRRQTVSLRSFRVFRVLLFFVFFMFFVSFVISCGSHRLRPTGRKADT